MLLKIGMLSLLLLNLQGCAGKRAPVVLNGSDEMFLLEVKANNVTILRQNPDGSYTNVPLETVNGYFISSPQAQMKQWEELRECVDSWNGRLEGEADIESGSPAESITR